MKLVKQIELEGSIFNNFTYLRYTRKQGAKFFCLFKCICGCEVEKRLDRVKSGEQKHCGCLKELRVRKNTPKKKRIIQEEKSMLINKLFNSYKKSALKRKYSFEIGLDYFSELIFNECHYCNSPPLQKLIGEGRKKIYEGIIYNGIDRVINDIGYTEENTVTCCGYCNRAKGVYSAEAMEEYIKRIRENITYANTEI